MKIYLFDDDVTFEPNTVSFSPPDVITYQGEFRFLLFIRHDRFVYAKVRRNVVAIEDVATVVEP